MRHIRFALIALALVLVLACPERLGLAWAGALGSGTKTCPATTNPSALSTISTPANWISIQAGTGNSGNIAVGGPAVTTTTGNILTASGSLYMGPLATANPYNLSQTFIACTGGSGDSITFLYLQ